MLMSFFFAAPFFQQAQATSMVELTMDQLIDASEEIVKGTIVATWTEQDPKTQMRTRWSGIVQYNPSHPNAPMGRFIFLILFCSIVCPGKNHNNV